MGKRKRCSKETTSRNNQTDPPPPPPPPPSSDNMPCSSDLESLCKEKSSKSVDCTESNILSPGIDIPDNTAKLLNVHSSLPHHHYNLGRSMFLKRSRHYYGHQYSRRNSGNNVNASSSHAKMIPSRDERFSFKFSGQCTSEYGRIAEYREKAFGRPERIRSTSLLIDAGPSDVGKKVCGVCQKLLRRKPYFLGDALSSGEYSVVAILVCGHVYHADCLEERTCLEDRRDPPCPSCLGLPSQIDATGRD